MLKTNYNVYSDELYHHGILGQKWGVRRYQNSDNSLTTEGKKRYGKAKKSKKTKKKNNKKTGLTAQEKIEIGVGATYAAIGLTIAVAGLLREPVKKIISDYNYNRSKIWVTDFTELPITDLVKIRN